MHSTAKKSCTRHADASHSRRETSQKQFDPCDQRNRPVAGFPARFTNHRDDKGRRFSFSQFTCGVGRTLDTASSPGSRITKLRPKHGARTTGALKEAGFSTCRLGWCGTSLRKGFRLVQVRPHCQPQISHIGSKSALRFTSPLATVDLSLHPTKAHFVSRLV